MPSARAEETPTVDATSSRVFPSESSCLPPRHLEFPEPSCTADSVQDRPTLSSPASPTASPPTETILKYFRDKILSEPIKSTKRGKRNKDDECEERIGYLLQAAQGFWKAANSQLKASEDISNMHGIDTSFLYPLHIAHHVQMMSKQWVDKKRRGEGQLTPAFEKTAASLSLDVQEVRNHHKWGRSYLQVAQHENGGPGVLLLIGPRVGTIWRRHLHERDVEHLLDYRIEFMPDHCTKAIEFDPPASKFIIKYMFARGWRDEMAELVWLTRHVNLKQLLEEQARKSTQEGEHWGGLPPDDSGLLHLLEAAEQPVVTDFMRPFLEEDQLNAWMRREF